LGIPIKTLRNWEQEIRNPSGWTLNLIIDKALDYQRDLHGTFDEKTGILSFMQIKNRVFQVACMYKIDKVYLFGSYAKGLAKESSDIDLYMESEIDGLDYFGLVEHFRETLSKRVDLLSPKMVVANSKVDLEIKETGVLIYERNISDGNPRNSQKNLR
jgi:predicted nucleotidyltransferase